MLKTIDIMCYPKLVSEFFTPRMMWYQTDTTVVVRILLQDVRDYYLQVKCDLLLFSTVLNEKKYCVCLHLFGTVVAERTSHVNVEREIKITLAKAHKWLDWLRLHIEKEKNHFVVLDPDHVYKRNWYMEPLKRIGERESFTEYKRRNNISQIMPDVPSTDEEESDDDAADMLFL